MQPYELSKDAEEDPREVARYTLKKWGMEQLAEYRQGTKETLHAIGVQDIIARQFSKNYPQLRVTKYRYHYIFLSLKMLKSPLALALSINDVTLLTSLQDV
jgi:plasmid stabilization system protein ParE